MSDKDKMRAEFEAYAEQRNWSVRQYLGSYYCSAAASGWQVWQAACGAGQVAEREAIFIHWEGADATIAEVERLREWNKRWRDMSNRLRREVGNLEVMLQRLREDRDTALDEVERLRAELAQYRKDWCNDDEAIKQQALRVLDAAKVEGDSVYVPRMGALAEMMADELVNVRAKLSAVRAELEKIVGETIKRNGWGAE